MLEDYSRFMQQAANTPSPSSKQGQNFGHLLARFAAPEKGFPPARDLDGLEADVATLSYEGALRAIARKIPNDLPAAPRPAPASPPQGAGAAATPAKSLRIVECEGPKPVRARRERKSSSVTIRLSLAEAQQLQARAEEAGLTVSAYLRSCAFEVESLRAQVKEAVTEFKAGRAAEQTPSERPSLLGRFGLHLWPARRAPGQK